MSAHSILIASSGAAERRATRLVFFVIGIAVAAWAPMIPFVKARAEMDAGMLGMLLLSFGAGSMIAMPLAGALAARFGCRRVLLASVCLICTGLSLLAVLSSIPLLLTALLIFGAGLGSADCVVNIQAVMVEREAGRPLMSGFHGLYSLGGIIGAVGMSALLSMGATPLTAIAVATLVMVLALAAALPGLLQRKAERGGPAFALPHGIVLFIGLLCFVVFLAEGSVLDWSAVFLIELRGADPTYAGLAYAAFSVTMTIGRFTGDAIVQRFGGVNVIVCGAACAAAGLVLATLIPAVEVALLGYALIGIGCANIVPVLYSALARQTVMPEAVAVPAVTTVGYAGILIGPATIGLVAHASSLPVAFLMLAALLAAVSISGRWLRV